LKEIDKFISDNSGKKLVHKNLLADKIGIKLFALSSYRRFNMRLLLHFRTVKNLKDLIWKTK
jgi:hypothetical protein